VSNALVEYVAECVCDDAERGEGETVGGSGIGAGLSVRGLHSALA